MIDTKRIKKEILILLAVLMACVLAFAGCGKEAAENEESAATGERVRNEESVRDDNATETVEEPVEETQKEASEEETGAADNAQPEKQEAAKKKTDDKKNDKASEKKTKEKEKKKKWVEPVYKTVEHPEEGHYETVTEWYCLCGKYVGSKEGWKKHREEFIASNGGVCNGEHVRPDPKEEQVWVVDKAAWSEQVLVSEGHWE